MNENENADLYSAFSENLMAMMEGFGVVTRIHSYCTS
jgi:hypothetical protein